MNIIKVLKGIGYWVISCTWGALMTLIGAVAALALLITGHKPHIFHYNIYFTIGAGWGGVDFGPFTIICKDFTAHTIEHEHGHGLQNIWWGPLMLIWGFWSVVRYWRDRIVHRSGNKEAIDKLPAYEDYWLEAQATKLGHKYFPREIIK